MKISISVLPHTPLKSPFLPPGTASSNRISALVGRPTSWAVWPLCLKNGGPRISLHIVAKKRPALLSSQRFESAILDVFKTFLNVFKRLKAPFLNVFFAIEILPPLSTYSILRL